MAQKTNQKSGIRARRRREAKRLRRDRVILRYITKLEEDSRQLHRLKGEPLEPLSVYAGKPERPDNPRLTFFPMRKQRDGRPMPHWNDLSAWMKVQITVKGMVQWEKEFLTFSVDIHRDLVRAWLADERDIRVEMRNRLRRELHKVRPGMEHFFVIEGWSKSSRAPTKLHIHGAALVEQVTEYAAIKIAAARAAGQFEKPERRAVHTDKFTREGPAYANYLFKSVKRKDERLPEKRLTMSRSVVQGARELWGLITGRPDC